MVYVLLLKPKRNYHLSVFAFMVKATDNSVWKRTNIQYKYHTSQFWWYANLWYAPGKKQAMVYRIWLNALAALAEVFLPATTRFCHFRHWNVDDEGTQLSEVSQINGIVHKTENCTILVAVPSLPLIGNGSERMSQVGSEIIPFHFYPIKFWAVSCSPCLILCY